MNLTPSERIRLRDVKSKFSERSERDQPDWLTYAIEDGVVRVRPLTLTDVLDWVERECQGEVT